MQIVDLRQIPSRLLDALFEEEQQRWLEELHWDYRPSVQLIRKFIEAKSLAGFAVLDRSNGAGGGAGTAALGRGAAAPRVAGYGFYVVEESKGLIGDLFVSGHYPKQPVARQILEEMLATLRAVPHLGRIESQLIPFGMVLDETLAELGFRLHPRQFMMLPLARAQFQAAPVTSGLRIEPWDDRHFEACAQLIFQAYDGHVDSEINDQYHSEPGAMKFLKNIIILPGCGTFLPEASFVVRPIASDRLVAVVLASSVSHGVGHTTQICILPGYRGHGLGLRLMEASIRALVSLRFHALSLTVTSANEKAVRLYERLGFNTLKTFAAAIWKNPDA